MQDRGQLPLPSVMGRSLGVVGTFEELEGSFYLLVEFTDMVWGIVAFRYSDFLVQVETARSTAELHILCGEIKQVS